MLVGNEEFQIDPNEVAFIAVNQKHLTIILKGNSTQVVMEGITPENRANLMKLIKDAVS